MSYNTLHPSLDVTPQRIQLVGEVNRALFFLGMVKGEAMSEWEDRVGLQEEDLAGEPAKVTAENVDEYEARFREQWAWLCPDLLAAE